MPGTLPRVRPRPLEVQDEAFNPFDREPLLAGRLLEQEERRKRLPVDLLALEDRVHLLRELLEVSHFPLLRVDECQVERHHGHVVVVPLVDEVLPHGSEETLGFLQAPEASLPRLGLARTYLGRAPLFHALRKKVRKALWEAYGVFVAAYREAAERWRAGDREAVFPAGSFPPALPFVTA